MQAGLCAFMNTNSGVMTSLAPTAAGTMLVTSGRGAPKPELVTSAVSFLGFSGESDPGCDKHGFQLAEAAAKLAR